jgi:hypothetical protein
MLVKAMDLLHRLDVGAHNFLSLSRPFAFGHEIACATIRAGSLAAVQYSCLSCNRVSQTAAPPRCENAGLGSVSLLAGAKLAPRSLRLE